MEEIREEPELNLLEPKQPHHFRGPTRTRGRFFVGLVIVCLIIAAAGLAYRHYTIAELPTDPVSYDPITLKPKKIGFLQSVKNLVLHSNNFLSGQSEDRINILLLGMGGPGHDGPYLTDTNIIISVKPSTNEAAMVSVPRDMGAEIDGAVRKINHANSIGESKQADTGGEYASILFSKIFDLDIPYYIRVDFQAFQEIVNAIGGINVNVPTSFTDAEFPGPDESYQTISFQSGSQVMLGERALQFARSRHGDNGEGSDFARARRQQLILSSLKEKLLSIGTYTNPVKIEKIWRSLNDHVTTNLNFGQLMYLASMARDLNGDIKTLVLDNSEKGFLVSSNNTPAGFILSPRAGNFNEINQAIANIFNNDSSDPGISTARAADLPMPKTQPVNPAATIEIQNGTWQVGLASTWQSMLQNKNLVVNKIGNTAKRPIKQTAIYLPRGQADKKVLEEITKLFPYPVIDELPEWLKTEYDNPATAEVETGDKYLPDTDILIILGEDIKNI